MTGAVITITVDDAEVRAAIDAMLARATNLRPAWKQAGKALSNSTRARFTSQTDPDGKAWAPLSPAYARAKAKKYPGGILQRAGGLLRTVHYEASSDGVRVGVNVAYGAIHQFGGVINRAARTQTIHHKVRVLKSGEVKFKPRFVRASQSNYAREVAVGAHTINMPARPFLGVSQDDRARLIEIFADHLSGGAGDASVGGA